MAIAATVTTRNARKEGATWLRLLIKILLPFAVAYFLSYLLRNLNAIIAPRLLNEFALDAAQLGTLTASYFLGFAFMQIPIGICLDRFAPSVVQAALYIVATVGVGLFGMAHSPTELLIARLLIGIGVSAGLVAGLKSIALWFPRERIALVNGVFIALGTLGAVAATAPAETLLESMNWRSLFLLLTCACASIAFVLCVWVPWPTERQRNVSVSLPRYGDVLRDPRLWRLAPLSGLSIGSAWALQGLWAGPWLADVGGLERATVVEHLLLMSCALSVGALGLGAAIRTLGKWQISVSQVLIGLVTCFMSSELALALHMPMPLIAPWCFVALMGAGTVATYSITAVLFDHSMLGRVNSVMNLCHVGCAFLMQSGIGFALAQWHQAEPGRYPAAAYSEALLALLGIQILALAWYSRSYSIKRLEPQKIVV